MTARRVVAASVLTALAAAWGAAPAAIAAPARATSRCTVVASTPALRAALLATERRGSSQAIRGPLGTVFHGRCGSTSYAAAMFFSRLTGPTDQPSLFARTPRRSWRRTGEAAGDFANLPHIPRALQDLWDLADYRGWDRLFRCRWNNLTACASHLSGWVLAHRPPQVAVARTLACRDVSIDVPGPEGGFGGSQIRATGLSCLTARRAVAGWGCRGRAPRGWTASSPLSGRVRMRNGRWRVSFQPAGAPWCRGG